MTFGITGTGGSGPSNYLIATEDGAICGYNRNVDSSSAIKAYDGSGSGAGYTGVALSFVTGGNGLPEHRLYAANFRAGTVDVFDSTFTPIALTGTNRFTDPDLPTPPAGLSWSPFNVHHIAFMGGPVGQGRRSATDPGGLRITLDHQQRDERCPGSRERRGGGVYASGAIPAGTSAGQWAAQFSVGHGYRSRVGRELWRT